MTTNPEEKQRIQSIHPKDIHKGDRLWESGQSGSIEFIVKDEPVCKGDYWEWIGITDEREVHFGISEKYPHYGPRIYKEPIYLHIVKPLTMNNESNKIREKIENSNISKEQKRIYNAIAPIIFSDSDTVDLDKLVSTIESLLEKERREGYNEANTISVSKPNKVTFAKRILRKFYRRGHTVYDLREVLKEVFKLNSSELNMTEMLKLTPKEGEVK